MQQQREQTKSFYYTKAWQRTREAYKKSKGGLCERCLERGIYKAGEIVHHKRPLTPETVNDPNEALSFENLCLLCRDCHGFIHRPDKRYKIDENGKLIVLG